MNIQWINRGCHMILLCLLTCVAQAQLISISPADASGEEQLTITFDASEGTGGLADASSIYMHSGVITTGPDGTDWEHVVGNWGQDDGIGKMTKAEGSDTKWQLTLTPRAYYNVPAGKNIFRLSMVFRDAAGTAEGKGTPGTYEWGTVASNGDIFVDLKVDAYVNITAPTASNVFLEANSTLPIVAEASANVSSMKLFVDDIEKASVTSGTSINFDYLATKSETITIKVTATINGSEVQSSTTVTIALRSAVPVVALPAGVKKGINYHEDQTKVTLVLEAPKKEFCYVVGDFNNWQVDDNYLMNQTPDGELFWIEISGLTPKTAYVFQYWVEGVIKIGDPYAELVVDPWNDQYIDSNIYPELPAYNKTEHGVATVLKTGQESYTWAASEQSWTPPRKDELVIYELLIRDFIGSHYYQDLTDSLTYLKNLGINAIELMPIMEFEGNNSWGYNPSYFFAPDKYYGTKNDLKQFIETAHQHGIAVILDMVLNHAFGQNAMVRMYWDDANNTVSADNPWFNPIATHPFNVGFDFNHESQYTQNFVDSVNRYWIEEYHFDGYRFDLSKGFTQTNYGDDVGKWSAYDQGRINLLTRMSEKIWSYDDDAYVILEHFADGSEENALANQGMILWRGLNHNYREALKGHGADLGGASARSHVSFMESHDEQRLAYDMKADGQASGSYNTRDKLVALERLKMGAAFHFLQSGPKMLWQFGELGYDIDINYIDRLAEKPLPWGEGNLGYYEDTLRQYVYDTYAAVLALRNAYPVAIRTGSYTANLSGDLKQFSITHPELDINVIGNFGLEAGAIDPNFPKTGTWYDYFSGAELSITNRNGEINLKPGEFHVYTGKKVSDGFPNVVAVYENPVTVDPGVFTISEEITITFDATKASPDGTNGLVEAAKVYMHAGVVTDGSDSEKLSKMVGTQTDDGLGEMTPVSGKADHWEITLTPKDYFNLEDGEVIYRIGMTFRDADNTNRAKGFRNKTIFLEVTQEGELISIAPADFSVSDEITITFNAALGNRGLLDASKVYMHSGIVTSDVDTPTGNDWTNVVGTWGADDGVGEMSKANGSNEWSITLTPEDYYGISGDGYWIAMVFRDASGNAKGSGPTGEISGGFIDGAGDIYLRIPLRKTGPLSSKEAKIIPFPNPAVNTLLIPNPDNQLRTLQIVDAAGREVFLEKSSTSKLDVSGLTEGLYLLRIWHGTAASHHRFVIKK